MPKKVLIVDDAIFMRNMIKDIFASSGFQVVGEAANGLEAVEKYKELRPDLTTMDIVMPFKSGIEATREIVKADTKAVIGARTPRAMAISVKRAIQNGSPMTMLKRYSARRATASPGSTRPGKTPKQPLWAPTRCV